MTHSSRNVQLAYLTAVAAVLSLLWLLLTAAPARAQDTMSFPKLSLPLLIAEPASSAPRITSSPALTATVGVTYTYTVQVSGYPSSTITLETSPEGMTVDETGLVQWLPTAEGAYSVTVRAGNGVPPDSVQSFTVDVADPNKALPDRIWDPRLDERGATLVEATALPGEEYWRLVEARWYNSVEAAGRHHIRMDVLDENGERTAGVPLLVSWADGSYPVVSEEKPGEPYAADYAMYALAPAYNAQPYDGRPADRVEGMGLGELDAPDFAHHTSYGLVWQLVTMPR